MAKRDDFHSIDASDGKRHFGSAPRVGQSKSYTSGSNAYGIHQRPTRGPEAGAKGVTRSDGPDAAGTGHASDLKGKPRAPR